MAIAGSRPEGGIRIEIERAGDAAAPWTYQGQAVTPGAQFPLRVVLSDRGDVHVELPSGAPPMLRTRVRLLVRSLWRRARDEGVAPARRLMRWRADD
ncbi:MAG TPA: hypothetical protein VEK07_10760 [Polyangiaceae bacterium]|nr:hypothetical protein [Polyangiaceae bacterium]